MGNVYELYSKFHTLFSIAKNFENRLRSDKVTESLKVGTFLRHSVVDRTTGTSAARRLVLPCDARCVSQAGLLLRDTIIISTRFNYLDTKYVSCRAIICSIKRGNF